MTACTCTYRICSAAWTLQLLCWKYSYLCTLGHTCTRHTYTDLLLATSNIHVLCMLYIHVHGMYINLMHEHTQCCSSVCWVGIRGHQMMVGGDLYTDVTSELCRGGMTITNTTHYCYSACGTSLFIYTYYSNSLK